MGFPQTHDSQVSQTLKLDSFAVLLANSLYRNNANFSNQATSNKYLTNSGLSYITQGEFWY